MLNRDGVFPVELLATCFMRVEFEGRTKSKQLCIHSEFSADLKRSSIVGGTGKFVWISWHTGQNGRMAPVCSCDAFWFLESVMMGVWLELSRVS